MNLNLKVELQLGFLHCITVDLSDSLISNFNVKVLGSQNVILTLILLLLVQFVFT